MKLSIIIPYYNAKEYTDELLDVLATQMTAEIECLLVDDGSEKPFKTKYKWCKVFRKENGGCSTARNVGLDNATGEYISFIDADDLVPEYFVRKLLETASSKP
ncbi:MAG: glycosyltransferase family 2 protein, partial [Lachnospiraceae bacterium]|nr:glycosyltransferase family 2 protein [Lachnospiraceae bacterium]